MYKKLFEKYISKFRNIDDIVQVYGNSGKLFRIRSKTSRYYEIFFNKNLHSSVYIPRLTAQQILYSPYFYVDDDGIILDLNDVLMAVVISRFEHLQGTDDGTVKYKFKQYKLLKRDISAVMRTYTGIIPYAYNNDLKIRNRIRVIKTYKETKKGKFYYESFGDAFWSGRIPNSENDIKKYAMLFNDPIRVEALTEGIYCCLTDENYSGVGYAADNKKITSLFPQKSNLPERLRQHYTSNYLEPAAPMTDILNAEAKPEKTMAIAVFCPIQAEENPVFKDDGPLGYNTLIGGEVLINEALSKYKYYIRRTFTTSSLNVDVVKENSVIQPGDILAYDVEGNADIIYDLKYRDALVEFVEKGLGSYKIVLKIKSNLGVARIISDYGIKGVTHPRKDLGTITLPKKIFGEDEILDVAMVIGPNSLKTDVNGIRLAWLALKQAILNEPQQLNVKPDKITEEEINNLTSDLQKITWHYNGQNYQVYAGFIGFNVTDIAKDCRSEDVRIMPETLKYMYLTDNENAIRIADLLVNNNILQEDKWILRESLHLTSNMISDKLPIWKYNDSVLLSVLNKYIFNIVDSVDITHNVQQTLLLNPLNNGFYIDFNGLIVRMPSSKLINYQSSVFLNKLVYPAYYTYAMWFLLSLRLLSNNKADKKQVMQNINRYLNAVNSVIFTKKAALPTVVAPIVTGGNLKQLVSSFVPQGITVILDNALSNKIKQFKLKYKKRIYDIGVRNPVLWRFQFRPKQIWLKDVFEKYLYSIGKTISNIILSDCSDGIVLRNTIDALYDQSDTDGDLFPIAVPLDMEIQDNIHKYILSEPKLYNYELSWVNAYISEEASNKNFLNAETVPFKYHTVERSFLANALADAAIAKMKVGNATVDLWKFHANCEYAFIEGKITRDEMLKLQFLFSRVVQDYVVRGIKHNTGGSSNYDIYNLNIFNKEAVREDLIYNMGCDEDTADLFIMIAENVKDNRVATALARLPGGGDVSMITKYLTYLTEINDKVRNCMSYSRMLSQYWDDLKSVNTDIKEFILDIEAEENDISIE